MKRIGTVYLVGAGPGDAGLMTLRGAELLARADVVVHDALINGDILGLAPPSAEIIYAGKRHGEHAIPQDELNQLLVAKARAGLCVVRLKGGDPYVFGRGGEEALALADAHIPFEVVPGVSSIAAAANYAGIPITHRDFCSSFTVFTGHEDPEKTGPDADWAQAAKTPGTKILLMGVTRIREISQALTAHGMDANTPVAMIRWGTTGRQQSIAGTLETIADAVERAGFKPPALTVIGQVVTLRPRLNWFEKLPLFGRRIVVTRARAQAGQLSRLLLERGADVLEIPTIRIEPPAEHRALADALLGLNAYDWLIFTSPNGVTTFFDYFFKAFDDTRDIGGVRIAAVGPATAHEIQKLHLKVDLMPAEATGPRGRVDGLREHREPQNAAFARRGRRKGTPAKTRGTGRHCGRHRLLQNRARNEGPQRRRRAPAQGGRRLDHLRQRVSGGELPRPLQPEPIVDSPSANQAGLHRP
jgi:uroporphyrinogen III methyltransferase/synthase